MELIAASERYLAACPAGYDGRTLGGGKGEGAEQEQLLLVAGGEGGVGALEAVPLDSPLAASARRSLSRTSSSSFSRDRSSGEGGERSSGEGGGEEGGALRHRQQQQQPQPAGKAQQALDVEAGALPASSPPATAPRHHALMRSATSKAAARPGASRWGASYATQLGVLFTRAVRVRRFETLSRQDLAQFVIVGGVCGLIWWQVGGGAWAGERALGRPQSLALETGWAAAAFQRTTTGAIAPDPSTWLPPCPCVAAQVGQSNTTLSAQNTMGLLFFESLFLSFRIMFVSRRSAAAALSFIFACRLLF